MLQKATLLGSRVTVDVKAKSFWIRVGPKASLVCEERLTKNRLCGGPLPLELQEVPKTARNSPGARRSNKGFLPTVAKGAQLHLLLDAGVLAIRVVRRDISVVRSY